MKKQFTEEQIIGFLREANVGLVIKELCRLRSTMHQPGIARWRAPLVDTLLLAPQGRRVDVRERVGDTRSKP